MNQGADKPFVVDPNVRIGHVHLKVADLDRALKFYSGILGLQITQRLGEGAVFLSAGGYHHHIALNTWESLGGSLPPRGTTGLYHTAIVYPTRAALAEAFRRVLVAEIPLEGAADHGVSESIYLRDPEGNGVELYWDRPKEQWPRTPDGRTISDVHSPPGLARSVQRSAARRPPKPRPARPVALAISLVQAQVRGPLLRQTPGSPGPV